MTINYSDRIDWLMAAEEPWVVYNTLLDLVGADPESREVKRAYVAMQKHPLVALLLETLAVWPPDKPLGKAYDAKDSIWKLNILGDFGLRRDDERMAAVGERVLAAQAEDGGFLHGGFDHTKSWHTRPYICISHVMTYVLARAGYLGDPRLERAYEHIQAWERPDGGWHPNKLNLPGNEREGEPSCPFGTVNVLRAVTANPGLRDSPLALNAAHFLLACWERRNEPWRPVGFGIGSTWNKVQYPFVQYQLLKVADTLAQIAAVRGDQRFQEMVEFLKRKQGGDGTWTAEGVNKPYGDFDFGQKKQPSRWLTFLAIRVIKRSQDSIGG